MDDWEVDDFQAWTLLTSDRYFGPLFKQVARQGCTICIPPDNALPTNPKEINEPFFKKYIFAPSKKFKNQYHALDNPNTALAELHGPNLEYLECKGKAWGPFPATAIILKKETIQMSSIGSVINVWILDRGLLNTQPPTQQQQQQQQAQSAAVPASLASMSPPRANSMGDFPSSASLDTKDKSSLTRSDRAATDVITNDSSFSGGGAQQISSPGIYAGASISSPVFGLPDHFIQDAVDYLSAVDPSLELLTSMNKQIALFRNSYRLLPGYEDDFFNKIKQMCLNQETAWNRALCNKTLSVKRQQHSTALAVEAYVHSQLYQRTFYAVLEKYEKEEEKIIATIKYLQSKNLKKSDFGADAALDAVDLSSVADTIQMLNIGTNPFEKLQYIRRITNAIISAVPEYMRGELSADAMLPLLSYCLVQYPTKHLYAHYKYIAIFPCEALTDCSELGYTAVSFQAAVEYLMNDAKELGEHCGVTQTPQTSERWTNGSNKGGDGEGL